MSQEEKMDADTQKLWDEVMEFACEQQQRFYEYLVECMTYEPDEHKYLKQNIAYALYGLPDQSIENVPEDDTKEIKHLPESDNSNNEPENDDDDDDDDDVHGDVTDLLKYDDKQQNIGYALYGPPDQSIENISEDITKEIKNLPESDNSNNEPENDDDDNMHVDVTDILKYDDKQQAVISKIYNKICECVLEKGKTQAIYCGIVYNIICAKPSLQSKKKDGAKQQDNNVNKENDGEEIALPISAVPMFAIRKSTAKQSKAAKERNEGFDTWYIDETARVYKSWSDYKENNNLPQCVMVLPKDGCYQKDENCPVTEDYSTVLLEIVDSPSCKWTAKVCTGIDIASTVLGLGGMGLCAAAMFTPLAPVAAITGLVATGATGAWSIGRSSQHLIDRSLHEESIHVFNKESFPHWLGLAGSATGIGVAGGSAALSMAAARGMTVNVVARTAFNTVTSGSLLFNGVGVAYQGYCIIDKYMTERTFSYVDTLSFVTHAMFFAGAVMNTQFASDIIKNTQGRIIDDYKENLRNKNFRKKFNRVRRRANVNNSNTISENAEVIRYIKHRQQLPSYKQGASTATSTNNNSSNPKQGATSTAMSNNKISPNPMVVWSFEKGKLKVNGITLIDPVEYVLFLLKSGIFTEAERSNRFAIDSQNGANNIVEQSMQVLGELLKKFYTDNNYPRSRCMPNFEPLIREMSSFPDIDKSYVILIFNIAVKLIKRSRNVEDFLLQTMTFVWQYCKRNLKEWNIKTYLRMRSESGSSILQKIIFAVSEAIEMIFDNLFVAFSLYIPKVILRN